MMIFKNIAQRCHPEPAFWVRDLPTVNMEQNKSNVI